LIPGSERQQALTLITEAMQAGARKEPACEVLGLSLRTVQRWERAGLADRRKGSRARPANALSETERVEALARLNSAEFAGESPNQVVPKLADRGEYLASEASMYRILREEKLLAHRQKSTPARRHEATPLEATAPNQIWSWDITWLAGPVRGGFFYLYLVLDLYSRKIVAWQVHERECAEYAAALATEACFLEGIAGEAVLVLHADNGGPMKGATMLATLQWLGVVPSFSRPRVSDDNPFPEALFRTLKYRPDYPERAFADIAAARDWVEQFVRWYNQEHQHSGLRFVTPHQRHSGQDVEILQGRHAVYQEARCRNPARWSQETRNWTPVGAVELISYRPKMKRPIHQEINQAA
jgi:transposase InsO family protein